MNPVAIVGVGVMGSAIASRLLDTGHALLVHDRSVEKCGPLAQRGAQIAQSPRAACAAAEFTLLSLNTADTVEQVT